MDEVSTPPSPLLIMKHSLIYSILIAIFISLVFLQFSIQREIIAHNQSIELQNFVNKRDSMLRNSYEYIRELEIRSDPETLWMARAIYSETNDSSEQVLVAQVIRNRVDSSYNGKTTYKDVILDPYQFSAFNPGYRLRWKVMNMSQTDTNDVSFMRAFEIAVRTRMLDSTNFQATHFYSPISMEPPFRKPTFANRYPRVRTDHIDDKRFRFYNSLD